VGPARDRLLVVGSWLGLGPSHHGAWARLSHEGWLLHFFVCALLKFTFCFALFTSFCAFSLVSGYLLAKHVFSRNKWNQVKVYAYVLKDCSFLLFWT
jgi:hypothetical protein